MGLVWDFDDTGMDQEYNRILIGLGWGYDENLICLWQDWDVTLMEL